MGFVRNFIHNRRTNSINRKASRLSEIGDSSLSAELESARDMVEYATARYERLESMYGYSEDRKDSLKDRMQEAKEKKREMAGIFPRPLRNWFWRLGITKKGREFRRLERRIRDYERTLNRMEKNGERHWEEIIEAEKDLYEAEENLSNVEKKIKDRFKEVKNKDQDELEKSQEEHREEMPEEERADEEITAENEQEKAETEKEFDEDAEFPSSEEEKKEKAETKQKNEFRAEMEDWPAKVFTENGINRDEIAEALRKRKNGMDEVEYLKYIGEKYVEELAEKRGVTAEQVGAGFTEKTYISLGAQAYARASKGEVKSQTEQEIVELINNTDKIVNIKANKDKDKEQENEMGA